MIAAPGAGHAAELRQVTELLVNQVAHWIPARWSPMGDAMHDMIQRVAGPGHRVPRLADTALPDQLRAVVAELIASAPDEPELAAAIEAVAGFRRTLS